ncbi:sugar (pentulose or hexulose) kinase [Inhella inkyongensis]|uniref:Sugar (Pentulose or hexulose) kinase n=1 Tax=Inhella inkyongensis TaxID=392593 RepID=A0A840RY34_9BURK|nr:FGGY-family carbohydrate kinase [Inhella inkyongensis]MBB5202855.1 sugar (pentulose or hexulose) kinase [Inhella inkyongensis]
MKDLLLSIDLGTQSVRALVYDLQGNLLGRQQQVFSDYQREHPGWMSHDGEGFWQAAAACCQRLWAQQREWQERIAGVSVTTQRGSIVPMDASGNCLAPVLIWLDQRQASVLPPIHPLWRAAFAVAGVAGTIATLQRDAEVNWWAQHAPDVHRKTHKFMLVSGLLNQRLSGRFADSIGSQVAYLPFDYKRHAWAPGSDWKWQALAVRPEQLPELLPVGSRIGEVTREASATTGIPAGTPVIAAAADKACEILGSGALAPEVGALSYGTTATINLTSPRYLEHTAFVPPYPAAVAGHYSAEVQITRGFWLVSWFKEQFGHPERAAAEGLGVAPEVLFDELVAQVPPGSLGLTLQPTWSPGIREPGPEAKGAIIGFGEAHTRAHLYRAILEGLAYALRSGRDKLEKKSGVHMKELRVSGGGSQSDAAMQLTADVFNLPTARPHTHETSGLGAAMDCAVGLGLHRDFETAVAEMTRVARWFEPQPEAVRTYDALYREVYSPLYGRLKPLYQQIQKITGYPARSH